MNMPHSASRVKGFQISKRFAEDKHENNNHIRYRQHFSRSSMLNPYSKNTDTRVKGLEVNFKA